MVLANLILWWEREGRSPSKPPKSSEAGGRRVCRRLCGRRVGRLDIRGRHVRRAQQRRNYALRAGGIRHLDGEERHQGPIAAAGMQRLNVDAKLIDDLSQRGDRLALMKRAGRFLGKLDGDLQLLPSG